MMTVIYILMHYLIYLTHWHGQRQLPSLLMFLPWVATTFQLINILTMGSDDFPMLC
jgi:hypothetical protein